MDPRGRRSTTRAAGRDGRADGRSGLAVPADVADPDSVDGLFDTVVDRFGRVDLLFNNAGMSAPPVPIEELDLDTGAEWSTSTSPALFLCPQAAFA